MKPFIERSEQDRIEINMKFIELMSTQDPRSLECWFSAAINSSCLEDFKERINVITEEG